MVLACSCGRPVGEGQIDRQISRSSYPNSGASPTLYPRALGHDRAAPWESERKAFHHKYAEDAEGKVVRFICRAMPFMTAANGASEPAP